MKEELNSEITIGDSTGFEKDMNIVITTGINGKEELVKIKSNDKVNNILTIKQSWYQKYFPTFSYIIGWMQLKFLFFRIKFFLKPTVRKLLKGFFVLKRK